MLNRVIIILSVIFAFIIGAVLSTLFWNYAPSGEDAQSKANEAIIKQSKANASAITSLSNLQIEANKLSSQLSDTKDMISSQADKYQQAKSDKDDLDTALASIQSAIKSVSSMKEQATSQSNSDKIKLNDTKTSTTSSQMTYKGEILVEQGDTLESLAKLVGTSPQHLIDLNPEYVVNNAFKVPIGSYLKF